MTMIQTFTYLTERMMALMRDSQYSPHIEDLVSLWNGKHWLCYIYSEYSSFIQRLPPRFLILQVMKSWVVACMGQRLQRQLCQKAVLYICISKRQKSPIS